MTPNGAIELTGLQAFGSDRMLELANVMESIEAKFQDDLDPNVYNRFVKDLLTAIDKSTGLLANTYKLNGDGTMSPQQRFWSGNQISQTKGLGLLNTPSNLWSEVIRFGADSLDSVIEYIAENYTHKLSNDITTYAPKDSAISLAYREGLNEDNKYVGEDLGKLLQFLDAGKDLTKISDMPDILTSALHALSETQWYDVLSDDSDFNQLIDAWENSKQQSSDIKQLVPLIEKVFGGLSVNNTSSDKQLGDEYTFQTSANRSLADKKAELRTLIAQRNAQAQSPAQSTLFATSDLQKEIITILRSGVKVDGQIFKETVIEKTEVQMPVPEPKKEKEERPPMEQSKQEKQAQEALNKEVDDATVKIDSTGKQTINTIQKIGAETAKITKITEDGVTKSTVELSNKYEVAMKSLFGKMQGMDSNFLFGADPSALEGDTLTEAQNMLLKYIDTYYKLSDAIQSYKNATTDTDKSKWQEEINQLQPALDSYENRLLSIAKTSQSFLGGNTPFAFMDGAQASNAIEYLKLLAMETESSAVAFAGAYNEGRKLVYDVLQDGIIKQYALEVDEATGNVRKLEVSEKALVNAFQNVNKVARQSEDLKHMYQIDGVNQDSDAMREYSTILENYKIQKQKMLEFSQEIWDQAREENKLVSLEEQNELYARSQEVLRLGNLVKSRYKQIATERDSVKGMGNFLLDEDGNAKGNLKDLMRNQLSAIADENTMTLDNVSFDSVSKVLTADLVDLLGNITKVKMQYKELMDTVIVTSDRSTASVDKTTASMDKLDASIRVALDNNFINKNMQAYKNYEAEVTKLAQMIFDMSNGTIAYNEENVQAWQAQRQAVIQMGQALVDVAKINNAKSIRGVSAVETQKNKKIAIEGAIEGMSPEAQSNVKYQAYISAYNKLIDLREKYKALGTLSNEKNQEELLKEASAVNKLAMEIEKLIQKSAQVNPDDNRAVNNVDNIEAEMKSWAEISEKGIKERWKFNSEAMSATYMLKDENNIVHEMAITYDELNQVMSRTEVQHYRVRTGMETFLDSLKAKFQEVARYTLSFGSLYKVWNVIRQGVAYVKDIDVALTELKKVTDETDATYDAFLKTMSKTAGTVGSTTSELTTMAAEWRRLGYSIEEAGELAESTAILLNVSEFNDATKATEALISTMQAFQYTADESQRVVDILNEVGKFIARR